MEHLKQMVQLSFSLEMKDLSYGNYRLLVREEILRMSQEELECMAHMIAKPSVSS